MSKNNPIHILPSHRGLTHEMLHVPADQPIPLSKIKGALKGASGVKKKRLVFAESAVEGKFNKK